MLAEQIPPCPCGAMRLVGGGGSVGGGLYQTWFTCTNCQRSIGALASQAPTFIVYAQVHAYKTAEAWMNDVLLKRVIAQNKPPFDPPRIPDGVQVLRRHDNGTWLVFTPENTKDLPMPEDPQRTSMEDFWRKQRQRLEATFNKSFLFDEVENQYDGDSSSPWYSFDFFGARVTVGWRWRVITINWDSKKLTPTLKAKSSDDGVTYYDGCIHARGADKFHEYMKILSIDLGAPR
jgi:hypothetical protein